MTYEQACVFFARHGSDDHAPFGSQPRIGGRAMPTDSQLREAIERAIASDAPPAHIAEAATVVGASCDWETLVLPARRRINAAAAVSCHRSEASGGDRG